MTRLATIQQGAGERTSSPGQLSCKLTVSELARLFDLKAPTVRYYEQIGVLPAARRTPAGYRLYGREDMRRLAFIQKAKRLGLELGEIGEILALRDRGQAPCTYVRQLLEQMIEEIDPRISELQELRAELRSLNTRARGLGVSPSAGGTCHILEKTSARR